VRGLIEETRNATGSAELPRTTNAVSSTRLDFAVHGIWQVPPPEHREDSSNEDAIEAMRMSSKNGGYKLAGFEALYRGRGEGNEEGVGPFITPLLDLHTSEPETWVAFKQLELRWVNDNFLRQGLPVSVNFFPTDFLQTGISETLLELHREDAAAFKLLHVELLEHEECCLKVVQAILEINRQTGLVCAKDDVGPETLSDPVKLAKLIELFKSLKGVLTVLKLDSSFVCGAMNVPLVPRSFSRAKAAFDKEVASKRCYREAWAAGMAEENRTLTFPLELVDSDHFTTASVVRVCQSRREAVEHAVDVVKGFLELTDALKYDVEIVAEVSVYANDFQRQLHHPIFGAFVKSLLDYAKRGKLFIQGSMAGGRAMSDAIVPSIVARQWGTESGESGVRDDSGEMKALIEQRQNSSHAGGDEAFHIAENFAVYEELLNSATTPKDCVYQEFDMAVKQICLEK